MKLLYLVCLLMLGIAGGLYILKDACMKVENIGGVVSPFYKKKWLLFVLLLLNFTGDIAVCYYADGIWNGLKLIIAMFIFTGAAWTDGNCKIIPNRYSLVLLVSRILIFIPEGILSWDSLSAEIIGSIVSVLICISFLLIMRKVTAGGLGFGDVKLLTAHSFLCGIYAAAGTLLIGLLFCVICSAVLIFRKKKTWKDTLPFGPFLFLGFWSVTLLGFF